MSKTDAQNGLYSIFNKSWQGAIIRVPTYRGYAKITVWYFFVFSRVPRRYTRICYSRTYISLLAITSKPSKVFKTVNNVSCTCKFHTSNIFSDRTRLLTLLSVFFAFARIVDAICYRLEWKIHQFSKISELRLLTLCP
jgi:hypothetical protein